MEMGGRGRHHLDGTARRFLFRLLCFPVICSKPAPATYRLPQGICSPIGSRVAGRNGERETERAKDVLQSSDDPPAPAKGYLKIEEAKRSGETCWFSGVINFPDKSAVSALSRVP